MPTLNFSQWAAFDIKEAETFKYIKKSWTHKLICLDEFAAIIWTNYFIVGMFIAK